MTEEEIQTLRKHRHDARHAASKACNLLSGVPGLSVEEQMDRISHAQRALNNALDAVAAATELIQTRDNDAYMAQKAERKLALAVEAEDDDDDADIA